MPTTEENELLYHVDLCILAYHLYHQTLIWPMDPFYEQQAYKGTSRRENFMSQLRTGPGALGSPAPATYKGPGQFHNPARPANANLDPVITDYSRLDPWRPSFFKCKEDSTWEFLQPDPAITGRIENVFVCEGAGTPQVAKEPVCTRPAGVDGEGHDTLYCFEGGTGGVGEGGHAWSMMGFVLASDRGAGPDYDVHIAFRGSRSGWGARGFGFGLTGCGNPDWVTDTAWNYIQKQDPMFSPKGLCKVGFSQSMKSILPALRACLLAVNSKKGIPPKNITITGHSLGGALATMCASALAIGNSLEGDDLLKEWPWQNVRLITFSAPTIGDETFCRVINSRIFARRVYISGDMITTEAGGGRHVGISIELPKLPGQSPVSQIAHDYLNVREQLLKYLLELGVVCETDEDIFKSERHANFGDLYKEKKSKMTAACLPDFDKHLKEYLNVYKDIAAMSTSYGSAPAAAGLAERKKKIDDLLQALTTIETADNALNAWNKAKWADDERVNNFLALCLVLHLFAKGKSIDGLPDALGKPLEKV